MNTGLTLRTMVSPPAAIAGPSAAPAPLPRCDASIRVATMADLPFIDSLQKLHTHMVGWMPMKQLEGKIAAGDVLIAEENRVSGVGCRVSGEESSGPNPETRDPNPELLGYCIGHDQYFKRDDVGIIYQLNVAPGRQRSLIGATLLKAMFDRAAYGCRLFCCWCAQDIEANRFWESMGFVPLAFRAGSEKRSRIHIFWQKRIVAGDNRTPWWFPSQTSAGSIREDRLVFPIPPGMHWSDAKPVILPEREGRDRASGIGDRVSGEQMKRLPGPTRTPTPEPRSVVPAQSDNPMRKRQAITAASGLRFRVAGEPVAGKKRETRLGEPKRKRKNDPKYVAAARELRDRYLEHVNAGGAELSSQARYEVARLLPAGPSPLSLPSAA